MPSVPAHACSVVPFGQRRRARVAAVGLRAARDDRARRELPARAAVGRERRVELPVGVALSVARIAPQNARMPPGTAVSAASWWPVQPALDRHRRADPAVRRDRRVEEIGALVPGDVEHAVAGARAARPGRCSSRRSAVTCFQVAACAAGAAASVSAAAMRSGLHVLRLTASPHARSRAWSSASGGCAPETP